MKLTQYGNFDESIENRTRKQLLEEFSETLDFARCQRKDGSFYGIAEGLQCRKGTKAAPIEKSKPKRPKRKAPKDTAERMAKAFDRNKKSDAIKPLNPAIEESDAKPKTKDAPTKKLAPKRLTPAKKETVEAAKTTKISKGTPAEKKKETDGSDAETKKKEALQLINSTETRLKAAMKAAKEEFEKTGSDEADDRIYTIRDQLQRIADDRKAIEGGIFSRPTPKQLTEAQRTRINNQISSLREKATGDSDENQERYFNLINLRDAKDPKEMAVAIRDRTQAKKELKVAKENDLKLLESGASWTERQALLKPIKDRVEEAERRIEYAKLDPNDRFSKYEMSRGMVKLLDSDSNPSQNGAHKNSTAIFGEWGELGTSKQAKALVKAYGGDEREVQKGIDAIVDFTRNDYRAIRRAVEQPGSDSIRAKQAQRIDQMLSRMDHPDVEKYRGINIPSSALDQMISAAQSKSTFSDPAPASWSTSALISAGYAGKVVPDRARVIFETRNRTGASVENFGQSGEKEILTPGGTKYRYTGHRVETFEGGPMHIFTVEEV